MKEADRLQSLMDRLLTPHRLPQPAPLNIHEVLERVRSLILAEYPRGIAIRRDYDTSVPLLKGDKEQMIQIVLNIARNAAQAMKGDGKLTFTTRIARQVTLARKRYKHALTVQINRHRARHSRGYARTRFSIRWSRAAKAAADWG